MNILYMLISGDTRVFAKRPAEYAGKVHAENPVSPEVTLEEIHENSDSTKEAEPFFTSVPTYLGGGNGLDNGDTEILTETVREYLEHEGNHKFCLGVVGSGDRDFNNRCCLTARRYA